MIFSVRAFAQLPTYLKTAYLIIFRSICATKRKSSFTKHQVPFPDDSKSELVGLLSTLFVYTEPI